MFVQGTARQAGKESALLSYNNNQSFMLVCLCCPVPAAVLQLKVLTLLNSTLSGPGPEPP